MSKISIRQFAGLVGLSHTAIRNMIEGYKKDTGIELGQKSGKGKAILLSDEDQEVLRSRIASRNLTPAASTNSNLELAVHETTYMPQPLRGIVSMPHFEIFAPDLAGIEASTKGNLNVFQQCRSALEQIVIADGVHQGQRLAAIHRNGLVAGFADGQVETLEMYQTAHAAQSKS